MGCPFKRQKGYYYCQCISKNLNDSKRKLNKIWVNQGNVNLKNG